MRFIIHQQPFERTIASGMLQYELDGKPTGAVEHFRMTTAVDGYRFLRVDLDARLAPSRRSTLYHLTLGANDRPEQLKYRAWADGLEVAGIITWDRDVLSATREVNGTSYEDSSTAEAFWFPSCAGLAQLRKFAGRAGRVGAATLEQDTAVIRETMALRLAEVKVVARESLELEVNGTAVATQEFDIDWDNQRRRVWLHGDGWPVRMWRDDGLTGIARQLFVYR